jgi:hypothetical protein
MGQLVMRAADPASRQNPQYLSTDIKLLHQTIFPIPTTTTAIPKNIEITCTINGQRCNPDINLVDLNAFSTLW